MKKHIIYTAYFGNRGRFNEPKSNIPDIDMICYTDFDIAEGCHQMIPVRKGREVKNSFYQIKKVKLDHMTPPMRNRFIKIMIPDEIFDNYEYSIYVDCKHPLIVDFEKYENLLNFPPPSDFLARQHPRRGCIYAEGKKCIDKGKGNRKDILRQLAFYKNDGYPENNGLYAGYWLFRRHTERLKEFSALWWEQLLKYSHRDQLSLPYVRWKYGMPIPLYCRPRRPRGFKVPEIIGR